MGDSVSDASRDMRAGAMERAVRRLHAAVLVGLCVAAVFVPVAQLAVRGDGWGRLVGTRHLGSTLMLLSDREVLRQVDGNFDAGSLDLVLNLGRLGLLLVLAGLVSLLLSLVAREAGEVSLRERVLGWGSVVALVVGAGLTTVALGQFPDDRILIGPSWGLLLPAFVAAWFLVGRRVDSDLW